MRRLANTAELLDGPLDDATALAGNLRDLRRVNALLGGVRLSRDAIDALVGAAGGGRAGIELLDVGTGGADIPVALIAYWRRNGRRLAVTAVDDRAEVLAAARLAWPDLDRVEGLRLDVADGLALPYDNRAFDIAHASLVIHHLEPDEDGPLSIRRAYTAVEMHALLAVAGLRPIATRRDFLRHRYAIAAVHA